MKSLKIGISLLIALSPYANSKTNEGKEICMGMQHSEYVSVCLSDTAKEKKGIYTKEYNIYLNSIRTKEKRPYNKKEIARLAKEAKKNWDNYLKDECLIESAIYEKESNGFNDTYNLCLIKSYIRRIEYYKNNRF